VLSYQQKSRLSSRESSGFTFLSVTEGNLNAASGDDRFYIGRATGVSQRRLEIR
jgi:hypothetical protein